VSFLIAVANSYWMNAKWTFGDSTSRATPMQGAQFIFVSILGSVLNIGGASYVATYVHPPLELRGYWPSVAALVGTICSFVFNFLGYRFFVFSPRQQAELEAAVLDDSVAPSDSD
jgi:putative flippase GtrA